jgi:plasmid stability protein
MAQFIVRHLEETVKARLKRRAARHGRSMEDEVRHILRDAVKDQNNQVSKLDSRIAARFAKVGLTTGLPEFHGHAPQAMILPSRRVRPIPAKAALREKNRCCDLDSGTRARSYAAGAADFCDRHENEIPYRRPRFKTEVAFLI